MKNPPITDLDYVKLFAQKLKENPSLFQDHKNFINSQIRTSQEIFLSHFGKKHFKENARKYLRKIGLLSTKHL